MIQGCGCERLRFRFQWLIAGLALLAGCTDATQNPAAAVAPVALSVSVIAPQELDWPHLLKAGGNVAAWQEAIIGAEIGNYRITEVHANVGDRVKKGQVLARIDPDTVASELAEARATEAEAAATLAEARANHERARQLSAKGFYSTQQNTQTQTAADTALARLNAARARLQAAELKHARATVRAPDAGIVSARAATVGTPTQPGQELFRLIRGGRLEWRAEVTAAELARLKPGQFALLTGPNGDAVEGRVRMIAPTVDAQTRTALVYVDLPATAGSTVSAGMYARGEFRLGQDRVSTLPQPAVLLREGFAYVFRVEGDKVVQTKVVTGRRMADRVEIMGLDAGARVVASGAGLLADGDTVRVVPAPTSAPIQ